MKNALWVSKVYLKAGTWGSELTSVSIKADNQENVRQDNEPNNPVDDGLHRTTKMFIMKRYNLKH